jgi:aspartyl-tRNA(Asn)/glutamyl-tRNA(Gln) amidotransferase subunit A
VHSLHALRDRLSQGSLKPGDVIRQLLDRIAQVNPALGAYTALDPEWVMRQAEALPAKASGRLYGVPITVKSNICVAGAETHCCSRILKGFRPPYDATVIERLRREGAVIVPGANMDEFAFGSSTENSAYGPCRNPWDEGRVPGGSSGGSAAAVSGGLAVAALGSDTGGSIRQPAAFCGVVGLKPTYGRVSRYGLVAFASSLDQIGPLTADVRDAAILLSVIAGHDERDSTSAPVDVPDYEAALSRPVAGSRLGIPELPEGASDEVRQSVDAARAELERLGMKAVGVKLPHLDKVVETYYVIATAEASSNLARYDGVRYGARAATGSGLGVGGWGAPDVISRPQP